ncbi:hypothetical protein I7I49_15310 [Sinorhizobium meliloti]|uniref:hypothetical protein n=1 Tax=Rhizobium meliloti TaxID=382 RepID=UPI00237FA326|nr:hypothetical protein [Sinorhizobium meliloti]MDE3811643.1 hypothetical protein [Sinorhizobium meliloti]
MTMREADLEFDEGRPDACPPTDAEDTDCVVFRAIPELPISADHFRSWVKAGLPNAKLHDCRHWGLSVWTSIEAVEHARGISDLMRSSYIASAALSVGDGLIKATPTKPQPQHHTLWCDINTDVPAKFTVIIHPEVEEP